MNDVSKAVSESIKSLGPRTYHRYDRALAFARKMQANANRVRKWGTGGHADDGRICREVVNAMSFGCGDEWNQRMIRQYEAAAKAALRFCTSRSR